MHSEDGYMYLLALVRGNEVGGRGARDAMRGEDVLSRGHRLFPLQDYRVVVLQIEPAPTRKQQSRRWFVVQSQNPNIKGGVHSRSGKWYLRYLSLEAVTSSASSASVLMGVLLNAITWAV
jgi:hypothetical protein